MSLSSILEESETRKFLKPYIRPPKMLDRPSVVVRGSSNPSRMGTALDYAIRFGLQARGGYPTDHRIVARGALPIVEGYSDWRHYRDTAAAELEGGLADVAEITASPELSERVARGCLRLAALDTIFRAHRIDELLSPPDEVAISELQSLYRLVPWDSLYPQAWGVLNPTFGIGSTLMGGADADVVVDGCLIEIKTIVSIAPALDIVRQLVGYALLANRYGVDEGPEGVSIDMLGIYFARAGHLFRFPLAACIAPEHHALVLDHLEERGGYRHLLRTPGISQS